MFRSPLSEKTLPTKVGEKIASIHRRSTRNVSKNIKDGHIIMDGKINLGFMNGIISSSSIYEVFSLKYFISDIKSVQFYS